MENIHVRKFLHARQNDPAWLLLASRRAPLVLGCLRPLFESGKQDVLWEDAVQQLAEMFAQHINSEEFDIPERNLAATARRELRVWMKRGLIVERDNLLLATNSLEQIFAFLDSLDNGAMTSTASRLATVQREIENLEAKLNPAKESRAAHLKTRIARLQNELEQVERGEFEVLQGAPAEEGVREIYQLAMSLRADFRRVEDSYREGDRKLRQQIVRSDQNRGDILDRLLEGHEELLQTTEGQVFDGFYNQLSHEVELDQMKRRLRAILENEATSSALSRKQRGELQYLVPNLVGESQRVIQARARGERDVKGFLQSGLASEHHRVGEIINHILETAWDIDWTTQSVRRTPADLPPVAVSVSNLPAVERTRLDQEIQLLTNFQELTFEKINLPDIEIRITRLESELLALTNPDSDTAKAREKFKLAEQELKALRETISRHDRNLAAIETKLETARLERDQFQETLGEPLVQPQHDLCQRHFPIPAEPTLQTLRKEQQATLSTLEKTIEEQEEKRTRIQESLIRHMAKAKELDSGALLESGTEIRDIPDYLERLRVLENEALPEKEKCFLEYLNKSSGQGVTQLLTNIESQVSIIEERIADLNRTLSLIDYRDGRYLQLDPQRTGHELLRTLDRARKKLTAAALRDDNGESHFRALREVISILRDAGEKIIKALNRFGLHPLFVTPNKEISLLKAHTRSAILVHNTSNQATLTSLTWQQIENFHKH